jgi:predicted small integral membrane protein
MLNQNSPKHPLLILIMITLVVAFGCTTNYFGNTEIEKHVSPMKSVPEAILVQPNFADL